MKEEMKGLYAAIILSLAVIFVTNWLFPQKKHPTNQEEKKVEIVSVPLVSLIFLKRSLVFPILLFSSISLDQSLRKAFFSLLAILWNSAFTTVAAAKATAAGIHYVKTHEENEIKSLQTLHSEIKDK